MKRNAQRILAGKREEKRYRRREESKLKLILKKVDMRVWSRFIWLRTETDCGSCEQRINF
jgi:hypothetical protein